MALIKQLVHFSGTWNLGLVISAQDILTASDECKHWTLSEAMETCQVHPAVSSALLKEYGNVQLRCVIPQVGEPKSIPFRQGIKTGSREASEIFNMLIVSATAPLMSSWRERGVGFHMPDSHVVIYHAWWVDNLSFWKID